MANNFRNEHPKRTFEKTYAKYGSYKPHLAKDFFNRCGYTDCPDFWFGGTNNFHIDHFIPWKNYPDKPELKTDYKNLVYSCSYINILKSNDEGDYIDPCDVDFNSHFERDGLGNIIPKKESVHANYMFKQLKLYMKWYQIIWVLELLFEKMEKLQIVIEDTDEGDLKNDMLITQGQLAGLMLKYKKYLSKSL